MDDTVHASNERASRWGLLLPVAAGAAGLFLLTAWCLVVRGPVIERDLVGRVRAATSEQGYAAAEISVLGRDVRLAGLPSDADPASLASAAQVWGVRSVTLAPDDRPRQWFSASFSQGSVMVEGNLGDSELAAMLEAQLEQAFAGRPVVNQIDVVARAGEAPASWPSTFLPLLTIAGRGIGDVELKLDEGTLEVRGTVRSESIVDSLSAQFTGAAPGLKIRNLLVPTESLEEAIKSALAGRRIGFGANSTELSESARDALDGVARVILDQPDSRIRIEGHTDTSGNTARNRELSRGRAESVARYLVSRGVPTESLTAVGFGPDHPIADNQTERGRRTNRRIEFKADRG